MNFDYIVIGAGPGGYSSAIRAAQLGLKTAVVERENAGGVCLNWGCIPTKALLTSAHLKHDAGKLGIQVSGSVQADLPSIIDRSRQVAARLQTGVKSLFKKYGVTLIEGSATFTAKNTIKVKNPTGETTLNFKNACIATGARARALPQLPFSQRVWQYRDALTVKKLPTSLIVVGGGAIGLEFADFYRCLGSEVTVIEMAPHILPNDDVKVASHLRKALEQRGMKFLEGAAITTLKENANGVSLTLKDSAGKDTTLDAAVLLVAIGVQPNTEELGIDAWGICNDKKFITVDENFCTQEKNIFAIGDVTQGKLLAHRAAHQGIYVAEFLAGKNPRQIPAIPSCIYTSPQVAAVGMNEKELKEIKREYEMGEFPWLASGMAIAAGEQNAFTRVFTDKKTGEILGAQVVGENAAELIGQVSLAMASELLAEDFLHAVFPHPTLAETIPEAFGVLM
ncbi:MAG TPA: dihydrolipoyl dehydrogenase, partial [Turneriella sp.]|nr:dihydrolipoyl dehydrogenase [Turneriella sp.]